MALIKCPECGKEISDKAAECVCCGYPLKSVPCPPVFPTNYESSISIENGASRVPSIIIGVVLQIIGLVVFFSFGSIDLSTRFGADFYTESYHAIAYIALALRWGLTGILIGLGGILEFHRSFTLQGSIHTNKRDRG